MNNMITDKGTVLFKKLQAEAERRGFPKLTEASNSQLLQLVHLLPDDVKQDIGQEAEKLGWKPEPILVEFIKVVAAAHTLKASLS